MNLSTNLGLSFKSAFTGQAASIGKTGRAWRFLNWLARVCRLCLWTTFCLWLCTSPIAHPEFYDYLMWRPVSKYSQGMYPAQSIMGIQRQDVFIPVKAAPVPSTLLHAWYFPVPHAKRVIIFHHGHGGNLTGYLTLLKEWMERGYSALIYDYEGYGLSSGSPSIAALPRDGEAAYHWLTDQKGFKANQVLHIGWSLGTNPAAIVGSQYPCAGIILMSPFKSIVSVSHHCLPLLNMWPEFMINMPDIGSADALAKPHPPTLIFAGVKDGMVPIEQGDAVYTDADKHALTYMRMSQSGHTNFSSVEPELYSEAIQKFLSQLPAT